MSSTVDFNNQIDFAFLDSGTGGIPYMIYLREKMPQCNCAYLGDTANFPYGQKSPEEITKCAASSIQLIINKWHPKTVVIGCNTISVTALDELRALFPETPIVGTVPAIKLAASVTVNKKIGLLATNATVNHPYCQNLINKFASDCEVYSRGDPELISFIEKKLFTSTDEEKLAAVTPAVKYFAEKNCDAIILGCTHFTHIAEKIAEAAGPLVKVVDSREGVVKQAIRVEEKFAAEKKADGQITDESKNKNLPESFTFYVTKATAEEMEEYKNLCSNFNIPWGGIIS